MTNDQRLKKREHECECRSFEYYDIDDVDAEVERLRTALVNSVQVIQTWHNMGVPEKQRSDLWDIYWQNAPELKPIREALTALDRSQP